MTYVVGRSNNMNQEDERMQATIQYYEKKYNRFVVSVVVYGIKGEGDNEEAESIYDENVWTESEYNRAVNVFTSVINKAREVTG
jgi:hypothetical protein